MSAGLGPELDIFSIFSWGVTLSGLVDNWTWTWVWHIFYFQLWYDIVGKLDLNLSFTYFLFSVEVWHCVDLLTTEPRCWHMPQLTHKCSCQCLPISIPSPSFPISCQLSPPPVPILQLIWYFIVNFLILALGVIVPGQLPNFAYSINSMKLSDFKWIHSNKAPILVDITRLETMKLIILMLFKLECKSESLQRMKASL